MTASWALRLRQGAAALIVVVAVAWGPGSGTPAGGAESAGGDNVVIVLNNVDGAAMSRSGVQVTTAAADTVETENLAHARSTCTDCRTVAVAVQAVLVTGDPSVVRPKNVAIAVNTDCLRCETFASAYQYVLSTGGPAHLSAEGQQQVASLRQQIASTAASGLSFTELDARLDALVAQMWQTIDEELVRAGGAPSGTRAEVNDSA